MGEIAVRGTTEYVVADAFREDLRVVRCARPCSASALHRALEDTITAKKGSDGRRAFSIARLVGPVAGALVATSVWYPSGYTGSEAGREIGISYAFSFLRNYLRELKP
jgi:hypothetical protein